MVAVTNTFVRRGIVRASELNQNFTDITDAVTPTAWTAVTFAGTWGDLGGSDQVCQYRKEGDVVRLRGACAGGTIATTAFTLPEGFRPPAKLNFAVATQSGYGRLIVPANGNVAPWTGSTTWFMIDCAFSVT